MLLAIIRLVLTALVGYLAGSFPSGVIVGKLYGIDVQAHGSGHTGATNVLRTAGGKAAAIVLILDIAKGALAVLLARFLLFPVSANPAGLNLALWAEPIAGLAAILGHNFSLFLRFKGGRGVATGGGAALAMNPLVIALALPLGALPVVFTRYVSLGSMTAAAVCAISELVFVLTRIDPNWAHFTYMLVGGVGIIAAHYDNIGRLLKGTERKIGQKVAAEAKPASDTPTS